MRITYAKAFSKDLDSIQQKEEVKKRLLECIEKIRRANALTDLKGIKKIEGFHGYYRIRIGEYRLGVKLTDNTLVLLRFLHRREIYRRFP